ncbi:pyridoxamine 5'-phosphate oxidase family protein [Streptomyces sp. NPDC007901]|uniref:pyridoxamine 5'-phosphate oxidase family protein n=1 Tax=Streptomyces sp. NPDC007901 TaxID=3364785 RepID=UPI0036E6B3E9
MSTYRVNPAAPDEAYVAFWRERHLCTLTTLRPDGSPGPARVITNKASAKVSHVPAAGPDGARVAVCQVAGRRWATLEGRAHVRTEPMGVPPLERSREWGRVAEAERRYAERYERVPGENPSRVVIEIEVERALGRG